MMLGAAWLLNITLFQFIFEILSQEVGNIAEVVGSLVSSSIKLYDLQFAGCVRIDS